MGLKLQWKHVFSSSRPCDIRAGSLSVTGTMHEADEIPNQDSSFIMLRPEVQGDRNRQRRRRSRGRTTHGVFAAGVFDGHGPQGHTASSLAAERMEFTLDRLLRDTKPKSLMNIVKQAFEEVATALNSAECSATSGSTGSVVVVKDDNVVIANVGDSTIMLISKTSWRAKRTIRYESPQHRPSNREEANRILSSGGFIQNGYVVDEGAKSGIAVSRTLGDRDMQQYGCVSKPDIQQFKLVPGDACVLLASDGFWDVPDLNVENLVGIVPKGRGTNPKEICKRMLKFASTQCRPSDDCTIACMTLN